MEVFKVNIEKMYFPINTNNLTRGVINYRGIIIVISFFFRY